MTPDEREVILALAQAWNAFLELPVQHQDDVPEFRRGIHALQEKVAARGALRDFNQ